VQVTPRAQGPDFVKQTGGKHGIKTLGNALMQPAALNWLQ
jgi:hypothetical protein